MLRIEDQVLVDIAERRRLVRLEHVACECAREQVVVDAEQHVALRVPRGQQRARDDLSCIARLQDP